MAQIESTAPVDARVEPSPSFVAVWPAVERRLRSLLHLRGFHGGDADDLVQEVALRAIRSAVPYSSSDDLYRWCAVVCRRLSIDQRRRVAPTNVPLDPFVLASEDVAETVERRAMLRHLEHLLQALPERDRAALEPTTAPSPGAVLVRRHRVRARLLMSLASARWALIRLDLRRIACRDAISECIPQIVAAGIVVAGGVVATAAGSYATQSDPPSASAARAADLSTSPSEQVSVDVVRAEPPAARVDVAPPVGAPETQQHVDLSSAVGGDAGIETRPRHDGDHVLCIDDNVVLGDVCTPI